MLKIVGMIMVISGCSLAGFELASKAEKKKENLINLKNAIDAMERGVSFFKKPLSEIFIKASEEVKEPVAELFFEVGGEIEKNPADAEKVWGEKLEKYSPKKFLPKPPKRSRC